MLIDARGQACPRPVMMAEAAPMLPLLMTTDGALVTITLPAVTTTLPLFTTTDGELASDTCNGLAAAWPSAEPLLSTKMNC